MKNKLILVLLFLPGIARAVGTGIVTTNDILVNPNFAGSSVTASAFFGDGSHLTGISASGSSGISTGTVNTAALTGNGNSSSPLGVNSSSVAVYGALGQLVSVSSITGGAFFGDGSHLTGIATSGGISTGVVTTSALGGNGNSPSPLSVNSSSVAVYGFLGQLVSASSVTGSAFFGDGSHLTGVDVGGISTGATTTAALTGNGGSFSPLGVNSSSVPVFQSGAYPPASGAALTSLTAANISAGTAGISVTGNSGTATALAANGSNAGSGFVCLGVDASGNCETAAVDSTTSGLSSSTEPWTSGAAQTSLALKAALSGATFTGAVGITNQALTLTGSAGVVTSASSVTASAFFGDGSHLSGVTASGVTAGNVTAGSFQNAGYTFPNVLGISGALTMGANQSIALSGASGNITSASSVTAGAFFGDGSHLTGIASTFSGGAVANVTTFASSITVNGSGGLLVASSVTAGSYFGDPSHLIAITGALIKSYAVGLLPYGALCTNGNQIYVPNSNFGNGPGSVSVLSSTGVIATTTLGNAPDSCSIDQNTGNVWITMYNDNAVSVLTSTGGLAFSFSVGANPVSSAWTPQGNWVVMQGDNAVRVYTSTGGFVATLSVGGNPNSITRDPVTGYVWITNQNDGTLSIYNPVTLALVNTVSSHGSTPVQAASDGMNMWVENFFGSPATVAVLTSTGGFVASIPVGNQPFGIAWDGANMWETNQASNTMYAINQNYVIVSSITVGNSPDAVLFDGTHIWEANQFDNTVNEYSDPVMPAAIQQPSYVAGLTRGAASPVGPASGDLTGIYPSPVLNASQPNVTRFTNAFGITATSSVTASAFFGDGSHLTGTSGGSFAGGAVPNVTTFASSITVNGTLGILTGSSVTASAFFGNGSNLSGVLPLSGGTMTGAINMGANQINNLASPSLPNDAATKTYVDSATFNIPTKSPARAVSTSALPSNTYTNGTAGIGATLTGLSIGVLTVDGVPLAVNDRLLVNGEAASANNGIYSVTANSSLVVYVLTRATDHDSPSEMPSGVSLFVDSGTANAKTQWVQIASVTTVGNSNSPVNFSQFTGSGGGGITALTGDGSASGSGSVALTLADTQTHIKSISPSAGLTVVSSMSILGSGGLGASTGTFTTVISTYVAGWNGSTMTTTGSLFFISSQTITGSTTTVTTVQTFFSTYTLSANTLNLGDVLAVQCAFTTNATAPGSPLEFATLSGASYGRAANSSNSSEIVLETDFQLWSSKKEVFFNDSVFSCAFGGGCSFANTSDPSWSIKSIDFTTAQTFGCSAQRSTGGSINFLWMKVSKR